MIGHESYRLLQEIEKDIIISKFTYYLIQTASSQFVYNLIVF